MSERSTEDLGEASYHCSGIDAEEDRSRDESKEIMIMKCILFTLTRFDWNPALRERKRF